MLLANFISEQRRLISGFIADPSRYFLRVSAPPEYEGLLLRLLQSLEDETGVMNVFFGFDHPFQTSVDFYANALKQIRDQLNVLPAELRPTLPDLGVEAGQAEAGFIERLGNFFPLLSRHVDHFVFIFFPATVADRSAFLLSAERLLKAARTPRIKLVFRDDRTRPALHPLEKLPGVSSLDFAFSPEEIESDLKQQVMNLDSSVVHRNRSLAMLAGFDIAKGNYAAAIEKQEQLVAHARFAGDSQEESAALFNLATSRYHSGESRSARDAYLRCLDIALEKDIHVMSVQAMLNVGNTHLAEQHYREAFEFYDGARRLARSIANPLLVCQALDSIGLVYVRSNDFAGAEKVWREAVALYTELDPSLAAAGEPGRVQQAHRLAWLLESMGRVDEASILRSQALRAQTKPNGVTPDVGRS